MDKMLKAVASAVLHAHAAHEESWDGTAYELEWCTCFEAACLACEAPVEFGELLYLANTWCNDVQLWAEAVLAGKYETVASRSPANLAEEVQDDNQ